MVSNVLVSLERAVNRLEAEVVKAEAAKAKAAKVSAATLEEEATATASAASAPVETREDSVPVPVLASEEKSSSPRCRSSMERFHLAPKPESERRRCRPLTDS